MSMNSERQLSKLQKADFIHFAKWLRAYIEKALATCFCQCLFGF